MADPRSILVRTPLKDGELLVHRLHAREELGRLFEYDLELLGLDPQVKIEDLLGKDMTVTLEMHDGDPRCFHGFIARFGQAGMLGRYTKYSCTLRPFLWFLTRTSDSRIFQGKTVPEIVTEVLKLHDFTDLLNKLQETHEPRESCVQSRESDFEFVSRLLEEEGIYYYFLHEEKKHSLVLADTRTSHKPPSGREKIPFIPPELNAHPREEHVRTWSLTQEVQSGAFALNDFDFESPRASLLTRLSRPLKHARNALEQYDPIAGFVDAHDVKDGNTGDPNAAKRAEGFARVRLEELQAEYDRAEAEGNARGVMVGSLFELVDHPRGDQNREYLVVAAEYAMVAPGFDAGGARAGEDDDKEPPYQVSFTVQPSKLPFRPRRITARPFIPGPHTAVVVGGSGDEIWTDKFGRVKVHFPWDRGGKGDDTSSCWVRVAQLWAGSAWGGLHVPRVGQEVIVEFIEGDPDRPIITGRVYNGANAPPFGMPAGATKSGILSRSSKGGGADNANEISFEDKKGSEVFHMHAEKDMATEVENDETHSVGHDRSRSVGHDETVHVTNDRKKTVDKNETETIGVDKKISVGSNHTETIGSKMTLSVGADCSETIGANRTLSVAASRTETIGSNSSTTVSVNSSEKVGAAKELTVGGKNAVTVGASSSLTVGGGHSETIGGDQSVTAAGGSTVKAGKDISQTAGANASHSAAKNITLTAGAALTISGKTHVIVEAGDDLLLKSGDAKIYLKKDGTILIEGKDIEIKGSGKITAKASSDMTLKGSKILQN